MNSPIPDMPSGNTATWERLVRRAVLAVRTASSVSVDRVMMVSRMEVSPITRCLPHPRYMLAADDYKDAQALHRMPE